MKICFLIQSLRQGGAERTVSYLAEYGVKNGFDVDVVVCEKTNFYELSPKIKLFYIDSESVVKNPIKRFFTLFNRKRNFKKYVQQNKPDIIVSLLMEPIFYTLNLKNRPIVIGSERSNPKYLKSKLKRCVRRFLLKRVDGMVFQTKRAQDFYNFLKCESVVIQNAVGNPDALKDIKCEKKENKIVAVGRITPEKDYKTLILAFKKVVADFPDYTLEIYGAGDNSELKNLCEQLNIAENVKFMGAHKDFICKIAPAKCYVLSSISEGMPNALMEAMASGMPCVSTDCENGPSELIRNNENGQLVPIQNPDEMAKAIEKFLIDEKFAKKCAENAKRIRESNSIESISKQYFQFFQEVLNDKRKN